MKVYITAWGNKVAISLICQNQSTLTLIPCGSKSDTKLYSAKIENKKQIARSQFWLIVHIQFEDILHSYCLEAYNNIYI